MNRLIPLLLKTFPLIPLLLPKTQNITIMYAAMITITVFPAVRSLLIVLISKYILLSDELILCEYLRYLVTPSKRIVQRQHRSHSIHIFLLHGL